MSIITACFSPPSPITSNKGIIPLSFQWKVKKHHNFQHKPTFLEIFSKRGSRNENEATERPQTENQRFHAWGYHFRFVPDFSRLLVSFRLRLPFFPFFPNFPSQSQNRFPSKWRETQQSLMSWLSVLAWQILWGWLSNVSLFLQNHAKSFYWTVFILPFLQLRPTASQSGRNHSWQQILDGVRWKGS